MTLLTKNSKIAKSSRKAFNFGIPAYQSSTGMKTCPNAAACAKGCYALAGAYRFSNVAKVFEARLQATLNPDFEARLIAEINMRGAELIRIHDSGDFYSQAYLDKWLRIIEQCPDVQFYAYTKMVSMLKSTQLPPNFTVVYSFGGTEDKLIDVNSDRHSLVFDSYDSMIAAGYADTNESDDNAADPSVQRIGLVYHGTKKLTNTDWLKVPALKRG
jgi:hypothetical protein